MTVPLASPTRLHWTRIGLLVGAAVVAASTFLPWLVGVPPNLLDIGSGTIRGITTVHGVIACVAMVGIALVALRRPRNLRPARSELVAVLVVTVLVLAVSSLVLGTNTAELYEVVRETAPDRDTANRTIIALAPLVRDLDMGSGGMLIVAGCGVLVITAVVGLFVKRPAA